MTYYEYQLFIRNPFETDEMYVYFKTFESKEKAVDYILAHKIDEKYENYYLEEIPIDKD